MHIHRAGQVAPLYPVNQPVEGSVSLRRATATRKKISSFGTALLGESDASAWAVERKAPDRRHDGDEENATSSGFSVEA